MFFNGAILLADALFLIAFVKGKSTFSRKKHLDPAVAGM